MVEVTRLWKCALRRRVLVTSAQLRIPNTVEAEAREQTLQRDPSVETFRSVAAPIECSTFNATFDVMPVRIARRCSGGIVAGSARSQ